MDILVLGSMNVTPHSSKQNLESGDLISQSGSAVWQLKCPKLNFEQADHMNFRLINDILIKSSA